MNWTVLIAFTPVLACLAFLYVLASILSREPRRKR